MLKVICKSCKQLINHYAHGLCKPCYTKEYQQKPEVKKRHAERERRRRKTNPEAYKVYETRRNQSEKRKKYNRLYNYTYYRNNCSRIKEYAISYRKADAQRQTIYKQRHRSRRRSQLATLTPTEWSELLIQFDYCCAYCGKSDDALQMEHIIPSSRGGPFTKENIVPACPLCNLRKKDLTAAEYQEFLIEMKEVPSDFTFGFL